MAGKLYVLGHPVGHSKSPVMHNAAYRALGLPWDYGLMDCATEDEARAFLDGRDWLALNVTMPYKPLALAIATRASAAAQLAGGANVLVRCGEGVVADNTDGKGCVSFLRRCGVAFEGAQVAVCGTGPTSLAIMHACAAAGAAQVALLGRDGAKAQQVLDGYRAQVPGRAFGATLLARSYEAGAGLLVESGLIVDATPLGMNPGDPAPFDTALLSPGQTVFDVVYGHGETALIAAARQAGCAAYDGAGMLVAQAVETVRDIAEATGSFTIPPDLDLFALMAEAAGLV